MNIHYIINYILTCIPAIRYCNGKVTNFGWDASGQSNLQELNVILKLKFMIRRTKAEVLDDLSNKKRYV